MIQTTIKAFITILALSGCSTPLFSQQVGHTTVTYTDASRSNRQIQTEVYYPATSAGDNTPISAGTFPLVVCGHGFVMSTDAYKNIWTALVPEGYIVALPATEGGFAPVHSEFGLDLKFLVTEIQGSGAGASVPASSVGTTSAIMGHSMGGGSSFLAAENNTVISTLVSFAAANTNPSSISAAPQVSVPTLIFSGTNDCVTPPAQHQDIMYDSTGAAYKTQVYITGGGHCYFADYNFNCFLGESTCQPAPTITRAEQHSTTFSFLKQWLGYFLKGDCDKAQEFQDALLAGAGITYRQSQSIACATGFTETQPIENRYSLFPNPSGGILTAESESEPIREIFICDPLGKTVLRFHFNQESLREVIDVSSLTAGTYFMKINNQTLKLFISN